MEQSGKLVIGAGLTVLLGLASHALGNGQRVIDRLTAEAEKALTAQKTRGVAVAFETSPLRRVALLSGHTDPQSRGLALAAVDAVPGVMDVRWVEPAGTASSPAQTPATAAEANLANNMGKPPSSATPATSKAAAPPVGVSPSSPCQAKVDSATTGRAITFRSGSPWVNFQARELIGDVARAMAQCPDARITVEGYADASGSKAINRTLSQARAEAVRTIMAEKGVDAARITARGMGAGESQGRNLADRSIRFMVEGG